MMTPKRLLKRLKQMSHLVQRGQRRGIYYEISPNNIGEPKTNMGAPNYRAEESVQKG
jgi:hypothetical protein